MKIKIHTVHEFKSSVAIKKSQEFDAKWQQVLRNDTRPKTEQVRKSVTRLNTAFDGLKLK